MKWYYKAFIALFVISLAGGFIWNAGHNNALYQAAQVEVNGQREVIAKQAFNFNRLNRVSEYASRNNSHIDDGTEKNSYRVSGVTTPRY